MPFILLTVVSASVLYFPVLPLPLSQDFDRFWRSVVETQGCLKQMLVDSSILLRNAKEPKKR